MSDVWEKTKIGDLATVVLGQSPPSNTYNQERDGLPFYQGKADFGRIFPVTRYWCSAPSKTAKSNDILMSVRAPVGDLNIASEDCCIGRGVAAIRAEKAESKYLYYQLDYHKPEISLLAQGSTFEAISGTEIRNFKLPNADIGEQKRIAEILTSVDKVIELTEIEIEKLKNLKKGMMQDLLTKGIGHTKFKDSPIGKIPESWELKKLHCFCEKIVDGTHHTPTYTEFGVPFLRVGDIQTVTTPIPQKFISQEEHNLLKKRVFPKRGDILLSKNGTVGIPRIVDWDWEFSIFVSLAHIRIKDSCLNNQFLIYVLDSEIIKEQMRKRSKQGTVTNLHLEEIREFDIPLPSIEEQLSINAALNSVNDRLKLAQSKHRKMNDMKKGLMQDLLTGKVRVKV